MRDEPKQPSTLRQAQDDRASDLEPLPSIPSRSREGKIKPSKNRLLQRSRPPNRKLFDARAKRRFLEVFAATANARMGAKAAGVAYPTVFKHRARDAEFACAWEDALAQGYARLEAEVLAAALSPSDFQRADGCDPSDEVEPLTPTLSPQEREFPAMTVEQKLMILREYRRGFGAGRRAPSARPVVASQEEAIAALAQAAGEFRGAGKARASGAGRGLGQPLDKLPSTRPRAGGTGGFGW